MKKLNLILCLILTLVTVTPALAKPGNEPIGLYLDFIDNYQEFPADTAFYMQNGYKLQREFLQELGISPGNLGFELEVQNDIIPVSYWEKYYVKEDGIFFMYSLWTHNFPDGLPAGTYQIIGHWIVPCSLALEVGLTDECAYPNADFAWDDYRMTVKFTE